MNEENKNLNENTEVVEPATPVKAEPSGIDKKKIGIMAGAAIIFIAVLVALIIALGGNGGSPEDNGNNGDNGDNKISTPDDSDDNKDNDTNDDTEDDTNQGTGDDEEEDNGYVEESDPVRDEFIAALGGVSDTYVGSVSKENYASAANAAESFVQDELAGEEHATIIAVDNKGTLSANEINKLNIPASLAGDYKSIEKIEVTYQLGGISGQAKSGVIVENQGEKKIKVYVINYGDYWKYFSPMPINGNTISKSYYDSVFNAEKYKNCTMETVTVTDVIGTTNGEAFSSKLELRQLVKHADNKIYCEITMTLSGDGGAPSSDTVKAYIESVDGEARCYVYNEVNGWELADFILLNISSIDELTPFYGQYLDYTYFTKTGYGFALSEENGREYFEKVLHDSFDALGGSISVDNVDADVMAEYYVSDGVLSGMRLDGYIKMSIDTEGYLTNVNERITTEIKCYDYGTTAFECTNPD